MGTLLIWKLFILRGSTGKRRHPGCGGPGTAGLTGSLCPLARPYAGASPCRHSLAGMNYQTWPRTRVDEPVIIFKFAIIDLGKSCGDKDELICKFIGEINPAVIEKPALLCRGGRRGVPSSVPGRAQGPLAPFSPPELLTRL